MVKKVNIQKMFPKVRFPSFIDNWQSNNLGILSDVRDGTHDSPKYVDRGFPLLTSKNLLKDWNIDMSNISYISEEDYCSINKRSKVDKWDILFWMIGTIGNPVRVLNIWFAIKNVALIKEKEQLRNSFLIHYLNSPSIAEQFYRQNAWWTQKFIALGEIRELIIKFPWLFEQQKIADFLWLIDKKIQYLSEKTEKLKKYRKWVMQQIFNQRICFRNVNKHNFPKWRKNTLEELETDWVIELWRGNVISKNDILKTPGTYPIYSSSISNKGLFWKFWKYMFNEELVTWSIDGWWHFFYRPKGKFSITNVSWYIRIKKSNILTYRFLWIELEMLHSRMLFNYQDKAHPSVIKKLYTLQIPYIWEQKRITDFILSIDIKLEYINQQIEKTKLWKKSLLQKMFI